MDHRRDDSQGCERRPDEWSIARTKGCSKGSQMLSINRLTWFVVSFCFALPIIGLMFARDEGSWASTALFAAAMAAIVTIFFGKGKR
ncbi:hypothetical protein GCM10027456_24010 [Kineosporia babensis]